MLERIAKFIKRKAINLIVVVIIFTIAFAFYLPAISFETNLSKFLPENELVRANSRVGNYFGPDFRVHYIYVAEHNRHHDVLAPEALREQYDLTRTARAIDGIIGTISIAEIINEICIQIPLINKSIPECTNTELENVVDTLIGILDGSINYTYYLQFVDPEFSLTIDDINAVADMFLPQAFDASDPATQTSPSTVILVQLSGSLGQSDSKSTAMELRDEITNDNFEEIRVEHTGADLIGADIDENSDVSFVLLGAGIVIFIVIVLALSFRRVSYVVLPLVTLLMATIWTFGTMIMLGIEFTVIEVAVIPLIIGLGVDYSVHISRRYQEELKRGKTIDDAMVKTLKIVGAALILAVLTTTIAFMANVTSDIKPIRDFGV
ncbi:MAG: MMPL family transporter, partial [Thermoplasmata archaeon]|nr:MMPL family transporter [Thermoplasmata archaeon]